MAADCQRPSSPILKPRIVAKRQSGETSSVSKKGMRYFNDEGGINEEGFLVNTQWTLRELWLLDGLDNGVWTAHGAHGYVLRALAPLFLYLRHTFLFCRFLYWLFLFFTFVFSVAFSTK